MAIEVSCRRCEQRFEPTPQAIKLGTWRDCPSCRRIEAADRAAMTMSPTPKPIQGKEHSA